ncbi:hypothetical protein WDU94_006104 [Cyamophila willieti]
MIRLKVSLTRLKHWIVNLFKCVHKVSSLKKKSFPYAFHYSFLRLLHWTGLIHLPNSSHSVRLNKLHQIYSWSVHFMLVETSGLLIVSLLFRSIHDTKDFMEKLIEVLFAMTFTAEILLIKIHIQKVLDLINYMEDHFLPVPPEIKKDCWKEEMITVVVVASSLMSVLIARIHETFLPWPQHDLDLIRELYGKKNPERLLPSNLWVPWIDTSEPIIYNIFYAYTTLMLILYLIAMAYCVLQITLFLTPLEGQFKVLAKCLAQLGRIPRDPLGMYVWTPEEILAVDKSSRLLYKPYSQKIRHPLKHYNDLCAIQCIKFSQILYKFIEKYRAFNSVVRDFTAVLLSTCVILSLYQIATLGQMSNHVIGKFICEFFLATVASWCVIRQSERFQTCQDLLRAGVTHCSVQHLSSKTRKNLCMTLMQADRFAKITFLKGVYVVDNMTLIKLFKIGYTLVNFIRWSNKSN